LFKVFLHSSQESFHNQNNRELIIFIYIYSFNQLEFPLILHVTSANGKDIWFGFNLLNLSFCSDNSDKPSIKHKQKGDKLENSEDKDTPSGPLFVPEVVVHPPPCYQDSTQADEENGLPKYECLFPQTHCTGLLKI